MRLHSYSERPLAPLLIGIVAIPSVYADQCAEAAQALNGASAVINKVLLTSDRCFAPVL